MISKKTPYKIYKRGKNVYLVETVNNALNINLDDLNDFEELRNILKKLAKDSEKNPSIRFEILYILQYYKLVQNISDDVLRELSSCGGIKVCNPQIIEKYRDEIKTQIFPKFFETYPDVVDFTTDNWKEWLGQLADKYAKLGTHYVQGFDVKKAITVYYHYNNKTFNVTNIDENKINEVKIKFLDNNLKLTKTQLFRNNLNGTLVFTSAFNNNKFNNNDIINETNKVINWDKIEKNDDSTNDVFKIVLTFNDNTVTSNIYYVNQYSYIDFIDSSLEKMMKDYQIEKNVHLDDYKQFPDGKKKK